MFALKYAWVHDAHQAQYSGIRNTHRENIATPIAHLAM